MSLDSPVPSGLSSREETPMSTSIYAMGRSAVPAKPGLPFIIGASSVGTLIEWYDFYLYGVLRRLLQQAFLLAGARSGAGLHPEPVRVLDRVSGPAVRRDRVRPSRRSDRPQVHVHADPAADGGRDLRRRPACRATRRSAFWRRSCSSRCACCRVWRSAANMAARRPISPSMRPTAGAGFIPPGSRPPRRWASSSPSS